MFLSLFFFLILVSLFPFFSADSQVSVFSSLLWRLLWPITAEVAFKGVAWGTRFAKAQDSWGNFWRMKPRGGGGGEMGGDIAGNSKTQKLSQNWVGVGCSQLAATLRNSPTWKGAAPQRDMNATSGWVDFSPKLPIAALTENPQPYKPQDCLALKFETQGFRTSSWFQFKLSDSYVAPRKRRGLHSHSDNEWNLLLCESKVKARRCIWFNF